MTRTTQRQSSAQDNEPSPSSNSIQVSHTSNATLSAKEHESASDNDNGERPVREKLKKTSIATLPKYGVTSAGAEHPADEDQFMATQNTVNEESPNVESNGQDKRGRPTRKRSFDDLEAAHQNAEEDTPVSKVHEGDRHGGHTRKRSRDVRADTPSRENGRRKTSREKVLLEESANEGQEDKTMSGSDEGGMRNSERPFTPPDQVEAMDEDAAHGVLSPRKKRSRDQVEQDQDKKQKVAATEEERARRNSEEEKKKKKKAAAQYTHELSQDAVIEPEPKIHLETSEGDGGKARDEMSTAKVSEYAFWHFTLPELPLLICYIRFLQRVGLPTPLLSLLSVPLQTPDHSRKLHLDSYPTRLPSSLRPRQPRSHLLALLLSPNLQHPRSPHQVPLPPQ